MRWLLFLISLMMIVANCGKKPLDRETARKLLEGRQFGTVQGAFPSTPDYLQFTGRDDEFRALVELDRAGVLMCSTAACQRGPRAQGAINGGGLNGFTYTAGSFVLGEITGITQPSPTAAVAQVRLNFQPTSFYAQYKALLDRLQTGKMATGFQAEPSLAQQTQGRTQQVQFQLFDDGWRAH